MKALHVCLLGLGFLVGCGGSASRDRHGSQPPPATGDAGNDSGGADGGRGVAGTTGAVDLAGRGGGASGATASGGSTPEPLGGTTGVAGGAGAAPGLPLPPGCEPRSHMETADACSLAVYCDTASQLTSCRRLDSGRWQCQCQLGHPDRVYQMEDAVGLPACALAASLCAEDELELGEESCEPTHEPQGSSNCRSDVACGKPIELAPDVKARAWLMRLITASCELSESGKTYRCRCSDGGVATDYDLLVEGDTLDCQPLLDFCLSGATPEFVGAQQCLLTNGASDSDGCYRNEICVVPMPLSDDVSLVKGEPRYSSCTPLPGGGAECYCAPGDDATFMFQLPGAADEAACESSSLNCGEDAVIEAKGPPRCEPAPLTAYTDSCESDLNCLQDATVDDREIVAEGRLLLACARTGSGMPWWCSCASDQETARFELGAPELSAGQACEQAPAGCLEHLSVHLGPYGEYIEPPDPLP